MPTCRGIFRTATRSAASTAPPTQLARLNRGELAVVQLAGRYLLVEQAVALQAQAIQAEALVLLCDPNAPPEDDVPADLVW